MIHVRVISTIFMTRVRVLTSSCASRREGTKKTVSNFLSKIKGIYIVQVLMTTRLGEK